MVDEGLDPTSGPPLISIGIPVRNGGRYLREALESVAGQDYAHFEAVVCDNGSEDETAGIAQEFAASDPRFRYLHNGADIGFLANFKRALAESSGTYFTWLAHDDLLSSPSYLRTLASYLEANPDVVACSCAFELSAFELAGSPEVKGFPELARDRWPGSRRELFRWPHGWIDLTIYGMFRREQLVKVPIREHTYRGQPHIFWWETDLLTNLSALGPIVAVPHCLRTYRRSTISAGTRTVSEVSTFDLLVLGLQIKVILLARAVRLPVPGPERVEVLATAFANLFRANLRQPYDHRREVRTLEREVAKLEAVAAERAQLIDRLTKVVLSRREQVAALSPGSEPSGAKPIDIEGPILNPGQPVPGAVTAKPGGVLRSFFTPPRVWQIEYYRGLSRRMAALRDHCSSQQQAIERLHGEAAVLGERLEGAADSGSADLPLVSIGLPVYNGEDRLAAAIGSVLNQDYANLELLIVDNNSNDGTAAIAQKFSEADQRIRYVRNPANIGFLPNFRKALDLSTGRYFTWLAHDDELSDPAYLSTTVAYLEEHPGVVGCHTAFWLLDNELPGSRQVMSFPEIATERRWPAARRALFRWPHGWLDSVIYGVFRRDEIVKISFPQWIYKGAPHIFCWEMDVLTRLAEAGRIVALPDCLRSYRLSSVSVGKQMGETVSSYDLLILGFRMKLRLIRRALRIRVARTERLLLVATALGNLFRANFRQPYDHRTVLHQRERELKLLQETAAERASLIDFLKKEIEARRQIVVSKGLGSQAADISTVDGASEPHVPADPVTPESRRDPASRLADFFRPLDESQVRRFYELSQLIGTYRKLCEQQASTIEHLTAEAERWLKLMYSGR